MDQMMLPFSFFHRSLCCLFSCLICVAVSFLACFIAACVCAYCAIAVVVVRLPQLPEDHPQKRLGCTCKADELITVLVWM